MPPEFILKFRPSLLLPLYAIAFLVTLTIPGICFSLNADSQVDDTVIAYISSSTDNHEIRMINPDGTHDRSLWRISSTVHSADGIGTLSWHPNATKLLFDSGHDWQRSLMIRDLYTLSADGQTLRRITNPPGPESYVRYQTGTVTFILDAYEQGDVQLYITGAPEPLSYFAKIGESYRITQTVADLGEGIRQYIRLYDPDTLSSYCNYSEEGWVDVISGETTDFGQLHFGIVSFTCPYVFSPTWSHDGSHIVYLYREAGIINPPHNLWMTNENADINSNGERLLNMNNHVGRGSIYRAVMAPTAARADEIFFLERNPLGDNIVYTTTTTDTASQRYLNPGSCPFNCSVLDLAWLPDGSGIIIARLDRVAGSRAAPTGVLYRYTFANQKLTKILGLPNEVIGRLAVSPDGTSIAFERSRAIKNTVSSVRLGEEVQCPCELWIVNSDGSGLRQLASDGRAPAWSPVAIPDLPLSNGETPASAETDPLKTDPLLREGGGGGGGVIQPLEVMLLPILLFLVTRRRTGALCIPQRTR